MNESPAAQRIRKRAAEWGVTNDSQPLEMRRLVNSFVIERDWDAATFEAFFEAGIALWDGPD